ncbi:hypothetical protein V8G61_03670 [Gaetbulibacter sp. M240]|uniref:hypothetical protein n=1 Tax=Gaetbulibacter sp. M240 TaxID=3126511 RepID=UPI00374E62C9
MKQLKNFQTFFILMLAFSMFSQEDLRENRHEFKYSIELEECTFDGTLVSPSNKQVMNQGWKFRIRNIINNGKEYVIQVSKFTSGKPDAEAQNKLTYKKSLTEDIYFKLTSDQYSDFAEEYKKKGSFVVGASTTLIKIRPGNGEDGDEAIYSEFGNDFNIGVTAGWRITDWKRDVSISLVGGIAFSSIKVTPQTTKDFIDSESTQSSITFSTGAIFEIQKFQISTFLGIDTMSGEIGRNWIYRNRPWIGLGFGYEIFKPKASPENKRP